MANRDPVKTAPVPFPVANAPYFATFLSFKIATYNNLKWERKEVKHGQRILIL